MGYRDIRRKRPDFPTRSIAVINQKGGVGKSTTVVNLSAALGELGLKVLVVDFDPQGNSTSGYGIEKNQLDSCIYNCLMDGLSIENIIKETIVEGVYLVPATVQLAGAEIELVSSIAREGRLRECLANIQEEFDYILIDCPPSLGLLTINALTAAESLLIPIQCEYYALEGVSKLLESMRMVQQHLNHSLKIFGVLLTMFDGRTILSRQVVEEVRKYFGEKVFETVIPRSVKISEAPSFGLPATLYEPSNKGTIAYRNLAEEVINRG